MSKAKEVLAFALSIVSKETDVPVSKIMSRCGETEVVDARWITAKLLQEYGFYTSRIAELLGVTPRYAQYMRTDFEDRIATNRCLQGNYERIRKKFGNGEEIIV